MSTINRRWLLAARPTGAVTTEILQRVKEPVPAELLVRVTHRRIRC